MKIKILAKRKGAGIGNQIQLIPGIVHLKNQGHDVFSDSELYEQLDVCPFELDKKADKYYVCIYYDWKDVIIERLKHPLSRIEGVKYKVGFTKPFSKEKNESGFGFNRSISFDFNISEVDTNRKLIPNSEKYYLPGWNPQDNIVAISPSDKFEKRFENFDLLTNKLIEAGYKVHVFNLPNEWKPKNGKYIRTENIKELNTELCKARFFIGVDNGVMHLADILGIPMIIFWKSTGFIKNAPINERSIILKTTTSVEKIMEIFNWAVTNL